jgi:hypothetical protein
MTTNDSICCPESTLARHEPVAYRPLAAALFNRGRTRLRELAQEPDDAPVPELAERERAF